MEFYPQTVRVARLWCRRVLDDPAEHPCQVCMMKAGLSSAMWLDEFPPEIAAGLAVVSPPGQIGPREKLINAVRLSGIS